MNSTAVQFAPLPVRGTRREMARYIRSNPGQSRKEIIDALHGRDKKGRSRKAFEMAYGACQTLGFTVIRNKRAYPATLEMYEGKESARQAVRDAAAKSAEKRKRPVANEKPQVKTRKVYRACLSENQRKWLSSEAKAAGVKQSTLFSRMIKSYEAGQVEKPEPSWKFWKRWGSA